MCGVCLGFNFNKLVGKKNWEYCGNLIKVWVLDYMKVLREYF